MRYSITSGMILAAMTIGEAMAGPAHAHMHRHAHQKKDTDWEATVNWNALGIDWSSAWAAGQHTSTSAVPAPTSVAQAATTTAAAAAHTTAASANKAEGIFNEEASLFDGLVGLANNLVGFGAVVPSNGAQGDNYPGNYGEPYASNMYIVSDGIIPADVSYTNLFKNNQSETITVNIWNKVGPDYQVLSGSALAPTNTSLTFVLQPGGETLVAFAEDSEVAWAQACSARTPSGAFQNTWGEAQLGSVTGSAYDVSAINNPNANYLMSITTSGGGCLSNPWVNSWVTASDYLGTSDGSCYIPPGNNVNLETTLGGTF